MRVLVKASGIEDQQYQFDHNVKAYEILDLIKDKITYPSYGCKVDNCYRGLLHNVHRDCTVEFLDIRNQAIWMVYQNSLVLLYLKAVHDVLGKDVLVSINNSLSKGLFTVIKAKIDQQTVEAIQKQMQYLVEKDLPISKQHIKKAAAIELAKSYKQYETVRLLNSLDYNDDIEIYSLEDEMEIFYNFLVPSTGYLQKFELRLYRNGVLLRYPHPSNPNVIPYFEDQKLLYDAFSEATKWGQLMQVNYVTDLNESIKNKKTLELYLLQEALHEKKISDIADMILQRKSRIVLICGPSSSGKTTFAKRLCVQLGVNGLKTLYLGTDDYFVEREQTPLDENGEKDFESIKAVDVKLFISDLQNLLDGNTVDIPTFDFKQGKKIFGQRMTRLEKNQIVVIEGIHALNQLLTEGIDEKEKFKIYISPFTPVSIDHHNRLPTTDCRLLRRMVRDYQFRGWDVSHTLESWPKVRAGEDTNIFPFHSQADVFFNSNCIYELAVLKKYAQPLLLEVSPSDSQYGEAQRMLDYLRFVDEVEDDENIVNNSIIREFIGGSVLVK
ncbi:MAG: nucleoside kinase [Erysipelotrichaceae bacterium]